MIKVNGKIFIIFIVSCLLATFFFSGCSENNNIKEFGEKAETAANRGNASLIVMSINIHNIICDEKDIVLDLPNTVNEFNNLISKYSVTLNNKEYKNALKWIAYNEVEDEFYVLDSIDD